MKPERRAEFVAAYGPDGVWARFYGGCDEFLGLTLHQDADDPLRFVTVDRFATPDARARWVRARQAEFDAIDRAWADATVEETFVGLFRPPDART